MVASLGLMTCLGLPVPAGAETPTDLFTTYLSIDTSNPPGGEERAAAFLADVLHHEGIATRLLVSPGGRTSLYARLDGGPETTGALLLLHHMDVVPPSEGWSVDPFGGELKDGNVWGAGAVDDKSLGIAHLEAFVQLHRAGAALDLDVILLAVSDEETGGIEGAAWLLDRHAELFADVGAVLAEGGNNRVFDGRTQWWGVEVAQKRPLWLEVTASGRSGHGSKLDLHTAPNKLIRALGRMLELPRQYRITAEARTYFESIERLSGDDGSDWLKRLETAIGAGRGERLLRPGQHNLFLDTMQVTLLESGRQINAIPARARALIDVRALPDTDLDELLSRIRTALGREVNVRVVLDAPRVEASPTDNPTYLCLERSLGRIAPVVPMLISGVTDGRYFRQRGIPTYGVSPFAIGAGDAQGIHGVDERLSRDVFERGVETMSELLRECATR